MAQDRLIRRILRFGRTAREATQVSRRLTTLLPMRIRELTHGKRGARGEREAYTSQDYEAFVDEWSEVYYEALSARVEYETHLMLYKARQSLAKHRQRQSRQHG